MKDTLIVAPRNHELQRTFTLKVRSIHLGAGIPCAWCSFKAWLCVLLVMSKRKAHPKWMGLLGLMGLPGKKDNSGDSFTSGGDSGMGSNEASRSTDSG
jgi:hypothetical protein